MDEYELDLDFDFDFENCYEFDDICLEDKALFYDNGELIPKKDFRHPKNGVFKVYQKNKKIRLEITYVNNQKNGLTKCYREDSNLIFWQQYYTNDKLDGICKNFDKKGNLIKEEAFVNGVKEGVDKEYYYNNQVREEIMYAKNQKNGFARKYYENGQIEHEAYFVNDKQEGVTKEYYESGKLKYEGTFKNGNPIGWGISYYENGNIKWKSPYGKLKGLEIKYYEDGNIEFTYESIGNKRNGKCIDYYKDGSIKSIAFCKNDKLDGELIEYYQNGKIRLKCTHKNGKRHGIVKFYRCNGKLRFECEYRKGKKEGLYKYYYSNGKLCCEHNYKNGLRNGYSIGYERLTGEIQYKVLYRKGELIDFYGNDGIVGVRGLNTTYKQEKKKETNIKKKFKPKRKIDAKFNLNLVNCSRDIEFLTEKILQSKKLNFSMCIYGEPGTGKSAYARYLADKLGIEVITKTAADLLDQYVGVGEKNIQEAFNEAKEKKAMLIIDEVDSFLRSRGFAQRNWEVTLVNQMLTCMENFDYPFICTTNFIDTLDQASLRRFTFKLKFGFLKKEKIKQCFGYIFKKEPSTKILNMNGLTVSDFVSIKKECDILEIEDITLIEKMLDETISLKESEELRNNIGFNFN